MATIIETENRKFGTFTFGANLDILKDAPLDTRTVVKTSAALLLPETWLAPNGDNYLYNGLVVAVIDDGTLYMCIDKVNYQLKTSWKQIDANALTDDLDNLKDIMVGGMHFIGVFNNIEDRDASINAKLPGNVCLVGTKEFVWSGDTSTGEWIELGDESLLSNTIKDVSILTKDVKANTKLIDDVSIRINNNKSYIDDVSIQLNDVSTRLNDISFTYDTSLPDNLLMTSNVGGYNKNTSVAALKGKNINEIIDDLLFPTVNPTITEPSVTLALKSTYKNILEINSSAPTEANFTVTHNFGSINIGTSKQNNRAGAVTNNIFYVDNSSTLISLLPSTPSTLLYKVVTTFDNGPLPKDSKGNNYGTAYKSGNVSSNNVSVYSVYPFFANASTNTAFNKLTLTTSTSFEVTMAPENPNRHIIKIPYNITKIEAYNTVAKEYLSFDMNNFTKNASGTEIIDINGINVTYNVYTRSESAISGETKFRITYSK